MINEILYLENNYLAAELVTLRLAKHGQVTVVDSENNFRKLIDYIAREGEVTKVNWPSVVVLDQEVRWIFPAPDTPIPPPEVREGGSANAGVRCYEYLRQAQKVEKTPVIFYSLVDPKQISAILQSKGIKEDPMDYQCVKKTSSFIELHRALERVLG